MMKKGFTLAEVLITLGIIGVVSALTLPNVVGNYQEKVLMTQLQKNYNMIRSVVPNAMQKEGATNPGELLGGVDKNSDFLRDYFEATLICKGAAKAGEGLFTPCLADSYTNLKGTQLNARELVDQSLMRSQTTCANVPSGATLCVSPRSGGAMSWLMDVNGKDKPNKIGKDVFWFALNKEAKPVLADEELNGKNSSTFDKNRYNKELNGEFCTPSNDTKSARVSSCLPYVISRGWKF